MTSALAFRGVSMEFPGVKALDDVSFGVRAGSIHALMGENGAGVRLWLPRSPAV